MKKQIVTLLLLFLPMVVNAAPDGDLLYQKHCSVCHGNGGGGGVGVPLSLSSFIDSVSDEYLRITIRVGRPGRIMPSFPTLSEAQVNAIVEFMRGWSNGPTVTHNPEPVVGDAGHGKLLFAEHCAECHGEKAEGGNGTGVTFSRKRELPIIAPALNNPGFLAAATDNMIKDTLIYGREGTPMKSSLVAGFSDKDIDDVVSYIRSLQTQQDDPIPAETVEAVITAESPYTIEETIENLKMAIADQNFTLIRTDYVERGFVDEGEENKQQVVLHFCNFNFLYQALAIDPRAGIFLPCRVTVTENDGKVQVATINPMRLSSLFNNDELQAACKEMSGIYQAIIEDAVL
ncbi:MAG: c-type cytochrome [Gammaproteobacteria bacterium]